MYHLRRPSDARLSELVAGQQSLDLTYADVGVTASDATPAGHARHAWTRSAGHGQRAFELSKAALRAWAGHRKAGAIVHPGDAAIEVGTLVALALPVTALWVTAVCRIVWVVDEPDAYGFAYGTLPHHPESGEESFVVRRHPDDSVVVEIVAVSRPQTVLTKLSGPVGSFIQRRTAASYLDGLAAGSGPR